MGVIEPTPAAIARIDAGDETVGRMLSDELADKGFRHNLAINSGRNSRSTPAKGLRGVFDIVGTSLPPCPFARGHGSLILRCHDQERTAARQ